MGVFMFRSMRIAPHPINRRLRKRDRAARTQSAEVSLARGVNAASPSQPKLNRTKTNRAATHFLFIGPPPRTAGAGQLAQQRRPPSGSGLSRTKAADAV